MLHVLMLAGVTAKTRVNATSGNDRTRMTLMVHPLMDEVLGRLPTKNPELGGTQNYPTSSMSGMVLFFLSTLLHTFSYLLCSHYMYLYICND